MNPEPTNFFVCHKCWNENLECEACHGITNNMPNKPLAERVSEDRIRIKSEKNVVELYNQYQRYRVTATYTFTTGTL